MHLLFPEVFAAGDEKGDKARNYHWFLDNTGSQRTPDIFLCAPSSESVTVIDYDTAWCPNNGTLQRLHEKTGWAIRNEYMEEGMGFCGLFTCEAGECENEERDLDTTLCEVCELRKPEEEFDEEQDGFICNACRETKTTS
jgi:hypothetical protein